MDEEQLQALISNFTMKGEKQSGEDDYKDFLVQYMNALNQGAEEEQLQMMAGMVSPERLGRMNEYDQSRPMHANPTVELESMGLQNLLRRR